MSNRSDRSSETIHAAAILDRYLPIITTRSDPEICQRGHIRAEHWAKEGRSRCLACARLQQRIREMVRPTYVPRVRPEITRDEELAYLAERQQRDQIFGHRVYGARVNAYDTGEERPKW